MDSDKRNALIQWINVLVSDAELKNLKDLKDNSTILLQILRDIEPEAQIPIGTNEKNIAYVCQYIKDLFNPDVVDEDKILLGNELEIGKLLCLILEQTLTCANNTENINKIQSLSNEVQTVVMLLTTMVCENNTKINFSEIMYSMLQKSTEQDKSEGSFDKSITLLPNQAMTDSPLLDSPKPKACSSLNTSSENTSPLGAFAASPQAVFRRVMVENCKLKQKIRHSEMFIKRRSQFDEQLVQDVETEKKEIIESNKRLMKEQTQYQQKTIELKESIAKLREEIDFLQDEGHSKDKEIDEQGIEIKKLQHLCNELQQTAEVCNENEDKMKQKHEMYEKEVLKNKTLNLKINEVEQNVADLKSSLLQVKESKEELRNEIEKKNHDHADQITHLQEENSRLEKHAVAKVEAKEESLAHSLQRDALITDLTEQNKKLKVTINAQECTIMNIAKASKTVEVELESCKHNLECLNKKSEETSESCKQQSKVYVGQINALQQQVKALTQVNKGLTEKINNAETKCQRLEVKFVKCEDSEKRINEQIQRQTEDLNTKDNMIVTMQADLGNEQKKLANQIHANKRLLLKVKNLENIEKEIVLLREEKASLAAQLDSRNTSYVDLENQSIMLKQQHAKTVGNMNTELLSKNEKIIKLEEECALLRCEKSRLDEYEVKYSEINAENIRLQEIKKKYIANLKESEKLHEVEKKCEELTSTNLKLAERNAKLIADNEILPTLEEKLAYLQEQNNILFEEKNCIETEQAKREENQNNIEELLNKERTNVQEIQILLDKQEESVLKYKTSYTELANELRLKDRLLKQVEDKFVDGQTKNCRSTALIRSLETQLASSDTVIRNLKKEIKQVKQQSEGLSKNVNNRLHDEHYDTITSDDTLTLTDLQSKSQESRAEEIFQKSRALRAKKRHSMMAMPETREETSDDNDNHITRTYSLRQKAERRRSFQPRRYMGGRTPPGQRTLVGEPAQIQMNNFAIVDVAEEPDVMDNMEWGRIAHLKESSHESDLNISDEEKSRLAELQRRNTLCLPHLKSSYPMELTVPKKNEEEKLSIEQHSSKRKLDLGDAPRGTFKKWKTDSALRSSSDLSQVDRIIQSDSNIRRSARLSPKLEKPPQQSVAFEITMEPAKNTRQRMPRAKGSGNLGVQNNTVRTASSNRTAVKTKISETSKPLATIKTITRSNRTSSPRNSDKKTEVAKFSRGESKRSSFSRATSRVAASFRGRKMSKK